MRIIEAILLKLTLLLEVTTDFRLLLDLYKEALYYSCENHILLPFFLEKESVAALLSRHGQHLKGLSHQEQQFHETVLATCEIKEDPPLSEREREIITLIAKGMSNQ